jgi:transmembrane sensor
MDKQKAEELIKKYLDNTCTREEKLLVEKWYNQLTDHQEDVPEITDWDAVGERIYKNLPGNPRGNTRTMFIRIVAAASIILCLSFGGYFLLHESPVQQIAKIQKNDIAPGGNKAILTLVGGRQIVLTGAKNGLVATQGNMAAQKTGNGQIAYVVSKSEIENSKSEIQYNTLTTPKGGQSWLTLADGTRVLLNADTKLTYPTAFTGKTREVTLTGEAYFEVAHNDKQPFRVITKEQIVQDIGTHFNINAYDDEPVIRTTLLEGSVNVSISNSPSPLERAEVRLKPGQQAQVKIAEINPKIGVISDIDTEAVVAWKNGYFMFDSENIQSIMRKVSRWYNVTIEYQGDIPQQAYSGNMSRFENVSQVLEMLEKTRTVHFKIENRRITVMK